MPQSPTNPQPVSPVRNSPTLNDSLSLEGSRPIGRVYLVGAGPGDPGLITVRGAECLRRADAILYDYLANPRILAYARPNAEKVCLGKHGRSRIWSQSEINAWLIEKARTGAQVVRLKGGDPCIFARGAEELEALQRHQIPFEVIPGITAALAASSYAGIPITHREWASAVAFVTGHEHDEKAAPAIDYASLARFPGTLVFYMGVTTANVWVAKLLAAGLEPKTPVAIIRHCSLPDQEVVTCTLDSVEKSLCEPERLRPPVIFVIGKVVTLAPLLSWFSKRPLFGQTVLVTRPADQTQELSAPLEEAGAQVFSQPAVVITPPDDWSPVDQAVSCLPNYDWVVFSSANGVRFFLDRLLALGHDMRRFGTNKIAALGPGTAAALRNYALQPDLIPQEHRAEGLLTELTERVVGQQVLLVRASRGREVLAEQLQAAGAAVTQIVAYASRDTVTADPDLIERLRTRQIDWVIVTSSAIARSVVNLYGELLRSARFVSMSPITSATLAELGFDADIEAPSATIPGIVAALIAQASQPRNA